MLSRLSKRRDEEGFTLIELLVVIIIIGILAAIAIPVFLNQRASAAKASLTSDARNGAVAIETFFTETQAYPDDDGDPTLAAQVTDLALSNNNAITDYAVTNNGTSFTYCVEATDGAATGWAVVYDSESGGTQEPLETGCP